MVIVFRFPLFEYLLTVLDVNAARQFTIDYFLPNEIIQDCVLRIKTSLR